MGKAEGKRQFEDIFNYDTSQSVSVLTACR